MRRQGTPISREALYEEVWTVGADRKLSHF
jgi:hypothetical protein